MQINMLPLNIRNEKHTNRKQPVCTNLAPLRADTVSFGAMKKAEFDGLDFAVVEKFKAPIEKFHTNMDLQKWAEKEIDEIKETDFGGRQEETKIQRKAILKEWIDYVTKENDAYNSAAALLILNAITKNLKPDNDKLPPVLNKGILADCISEIDKNVRQDKKYKFDLNKMYETKLRELYLEDTPTGETATKWIIIPSKKHDRKNFQKNVEKLKVLSHKNWCTKSFNAEPYLKKGDFHVYLENGKPKLGVRFVGNIFGNKIQEIQGELNNGRIPLSYFEQVKEHIEENRYKLTSDAKKKIEKAAKAREKVDKIRKDLDDAITKNDVKRIFEYFKIGVKEDENGLLTITCYDQPSTDFTYSDLGIDENRLFENVKAISGCADFENSQITSLGKLQSIGGNAYFKYSQITSLGKLQSIGGSADFKYSQITSLGNLESIGGNAYFKYSQITSLGKLQSIGGSADFVDSQVTSLGNLESIGGNAYFEDSQVTSLGNLESIGGAAYFGNSQVTDLGSLKTVAKVVYLKNSKLKPEDFNGIIVGYFVTINE